MKDNNGFTLVELIVTIAILGLLSVTIGMSITNMLNKQTDKKYDQYVETIEEAACLYAETNSDCNFKSCRVTLKTLIEKGLLSKDLVNPNKELNPNQLPVSSYPSKYVQVTWSNGEKTCTYEE